ncbi:MAG: CoA-binding protein [Thermoplasmatales archaeon]|nr:CoA-binding protein [Thermoplasmatales archaeon]
MSSLDFFFNPKSIAVIGASRTPGKIGYEALKNVLIYEYKGDVYPVNPNADEVLGLRAYSSVKEIKGDVELGLIVVPAEFVPRALEECGEKGVRGAVIISSGFVEIGNSELGEKVLRIAKKYKIRILGPNTMGFKNANQGLDASFVFGMPYKGRIGIASQSGALSIGIIYYALLERIGLSKVIGMGNKLDIDDADIIEYLSRDESTRVICMYIEGLKDGKRFLEAAGKCKKPIVVLKAGRTKAGALAAVSHTGALAGADEVYDSVFRQVNIIRAKDVTELFDFANALAHQPPAGGKRIGIISNGGGAGILLADACSENGLLVPELGARTIKKLEEVLPALVKPGNPVDLVGNAGFYRYEAVMRALLEDGNIDGIIVTCVHAGYARPREYAGAVLKMIDMQRKKPAPDKPIICCWIGGREVEEVIEDLKIENVPVYRDTTRAARAMLALVKEGGRLGLHTHKRSE